MLSKVIERLKNREASPVYRRVREKGRMTPEGLNYVQSWVEPTLTACFPPLECEHAPLLEEWANSLEGF